MKYHIELTNSARTDLVEIYRYIAYELNSSRNAKGQIARLKKAIMSLDEMPERYRRYENVKWAKRNMRIMPVDNYIIFYIPTDESKTVTIMRVMYRARDIDKCLDEI